MIKREKKTKPAVWTTVAGAKTKKSTKAAERNAYRKAAREFIAAHRKTGLTCCVVEEIEELREGKKYGHPISNRISEVHHMRGRTGKLLMDQRFWKAVSKEGHRWIHEHMEEARKHGWLCKRGDWGRQS